MKNLDIREFYRKLKRDGKSTEEIFNVMSEIYGSRFSKAIEAVKKGRIKKYIFEPSGKRIWIVVGKKCDYIVLTDVGFCSCNDFYYRIMNDEPSLCYHLIACWIAQVIGKFDLIREEDELYDFLLNDWKNQFLNIKNF